METRLRRIDELEQENAALREVNDILRKAVAYYTRSLGGLAGEGVVAARASGADVLHGAAGSDRAERATLARRETSRDKGNC
ncbi:hypothetical protein BG57_07000 [Caballeronia grimmiae]|uniref:Uncharacterized protein n=1 Tax=Caballeronia grimmiae TaxID=1071679 RepID=A0A069P0P8_9BURK|nr:hypothetical protein BG57_07000 [Caballeronia grimmiae]